MSNATKRNFPIKQQRSRHGGESLRAQFSEESERFYFGGGFGGALIVAALLLIANHSLDQLFNPLLIAACFLVIGAAIAGLSIRRLFNRGRPIQLGLAGEESVADDFRRLERHGYHVFHDIPSTNRPGGANIDHVVVGPAGIFAIETKTRSKGSRETIEYDGLTIRIGNRPPTDEPLLQARAVAREISECLDGRRVTPVVLFPGWNVRTPKPRHWDYHVVVTTTKYFVNGLVDRRVPDRLTPEQVQTSATFLNAHTRGMASASTP